MAIVRPMPPGRYDARHIAQWIVSVASCEATRCRHWACACAVLARRTPWSSPSPSCENTNKTQLLAINYRTFLLTNRVIFGTQNAHQSYELRLDVKCHNWS